MTTYKIVPHQGIGPVQLGMSRTEVRSAVPAAHRSFRRSQWSEYETDAFEQAGFYVSYTGARPQVAFIEVASVSGVKFILSGLDPFAESAEVLLKALQAETEVVEKERGSSFILPQWDVSLWRQAVKEKRFEAVGAGGKGYFESEPA